jgi:recombination protein RecT
MATNNQIAAQQQQKTIGNFLNFPATQKFLEENLQERKSEFVSNLIAMTEADDNLKACDPKELMMCAMNATALNLPLNKNLGYAYIIPYKGVPSFQIGYKGLIQLAIRTGMYEIINACEIREGEIERNKITGEITYKGEKPDNQVIGYLSYLKLKTGFSASLYMSEADMEKHALRFSKMYQSDKQYKSAKSKWSDPDARPKMCLKTVLKGLLGTYGLMTTELQRAFEADNETEYSGGNANRDFEDAKVIPQNEPAATGNQNQPQKIEI